MRRRRLRLGHPPRDELLRARELLDGDVALGGAGLRGTPPALGGSGRAAPAGLGRARPPPRAGAAPAGLGRSASAPRPRAPSPPDAAASTSALTIRPPGPLPSQRGQVDAVLAGDAARDGRGLGAAAVAVGEVTVESPAHPAGHRAAPSPSKATIPHFTLSMDVDMEGAVELRDQLKTLASDADAGAVLQRHGRQGVRDRPARLLARQRRLPPTASSTLGGVNIGSRSRARARSSSRRSSTPTARARHDSDRVARARREGPRRQDQPARAVRRESSTTNLGCTVAHFTAVIDPADRDPRGGQDGAQAGGARRRGRRAQQ